MYNYRAIVRKVYDGDTITVDIDLGFGIVFNGQKIRLYGINAPEVRGETRMEGLASRDWLREKILDKVVEIQTHKDAKGKYGRYIGQVSINGENINESLINEGLAERKEY